MTKRGECARNMATRACAAGNSSSHAGSMVWSASITSRPAKLPGRFRQDPSGCKTLDATAGRQYDSVPGPAPPGKR